MKVKRAASAPRQPRRRPPPQSAAAATPFCDTASTRTSETERDCLGPFDILKTVKILHLRLVQPWSKRVSRLSRFRIHHVSALSSPLYLPSQNGGAVAASARGTGGWHAARSLQMESKKST